MEKTIHKYTALTFLLSIMATCLHATTPYFSARSQGTDAARELVGMANEYHRNLYDMDEFYGSFSITPEYTRSFRPGRIARCLFGSDLGNGDCSSLLIQGSAVANRNENAWLADYFGLPADFESTFTFEPRVSNVIVDFGLCLGFDNWCTGLYLKLHAPFVHSRWELNACETGITAGTLSHLGGYFDADLSASPLRSATPRSDLLANASQFFIGGQAPSLGFTSNAEDASTHVGFTGLQCSRWSSCKETKNGLATFSAALGWNFLLEDDYHLGVEFRAAAPTGNRPKGCYLFEPMIGNGNHWEVGGGISGHYTFWRCDDSDSSIGLWIDANIMHLVKTRQHRSFDLIKSGENSRYMLAMKMTTTVPEELTGTSETPSAQFDNLFQPVANLTCCDVKVGSAVQGDVAALFNYTRGCFHWDLGYNFWGRSCEKIDFDCGDCPCPLQSTTEKWALKGDVRVFGYEEESEGPITANSTSHALSATNSTATIHGGTNSANGFDNTKADNPQAASFDGTALQVPTGVAVASVPVSLSLDPVTLTLNDIDLGAARTRGISHKIFTHFQWTWKDRECWVPYVGIGAKVEFASRKSGSSSCDTECAPTTSSNTNNNGISCSTPCATDCNPCSRCNLSEWGVWLKGGISFN